MVKILSDELITDVDYIIIEIHPECEWFAFRHEFEGKSMRCIEIFEKDSSAGFCFNHKDDCPVEFNSNRPFCLFRAVAFVSLPISEDLFIHSVCNDG